MAGPPRKGAISPPKGRGSAGSCCDHSGVLPFPALVAEAVGVIEVWKYRSRILAATGAAVSTPNPPRSIVTATTICGFFAGAMTMYQDWSGWLGRWAVPVLPATWIGKFPKTGYEVPPGSVAARVRPVMIV